MAPKKEQAKASSRRRPTLGVLGAPVYDSEEDEDFVPDDQPPTKSGRKAHNRSGACDAAGMAEQTDTNLPHRNIRLHDSSEEKRLRTRSEGSGRPSTSSHARSAKRLAADGGAAAAAAAATSMAAPDARDRDWSCLTEPILVAVLRRACAVSALPTAATAACVCRHWRDVCKNLEEEVKAAAEAAAAIADMEAAVEGEAAAAEAAAAARSAAMAVAAATAASALCNVMDTDAPITATDDDSTAAAAAWPARDGGGGSGRSPCSGAGSLWFCLNVRSRPSIRFTNEVVHKGLASRRWSQVLTLKLRTCTGLTPDGLVALAGGCPGLTCLELSQCESLIKLESMRAVMSSLPRLRVLDLSHNAISVMDHVVKLALAPRPRPLHQQQQVATANARGEGSVAGAGGGSFQSTDGSSGGSGMLPCPLQVLRVRGCVRLGPATLRALSPSVPYVTLTPTPLRQQQQLSPDDDAPVAEPLRIPLFVHLTELDLTGSGSLTTGGLLSVEKLQAAAPNLRALRLDATASAQQSGLRLAPEPERAGPGFPRLRLCELGLSRTAQGTEQPQSRRQGCTISVLRRFVGGSPQLRVLDVSGTQSIEDKRLIDNLAKDVEAGEGGDAVAEARAAAALAENAAMGVAAMRPGRGGRPTGFSKVFPNGPEDIEWRMARLMQSLGPALRPALVGPLRVLRASKSVLATDAGLHAIAVRFGGTLEEMDVSESSNVTDAGLLHVACNCTALTALDVSSTLITDFGVRVLMALRYAGSDDRVAETGRVPGADGVGPSGCDGAASATKLATASRHAPVVHDLVSDDDEEGEKANGVGTRHLRHLNLSSCRGVDRPTRHAAGAGLDTLWHVLNRS